jgi:hypothetical protein
VISQAFPPISRSKTKLYADDRQAFVRRAARHAALRNLAAVYVFEPDSKRIDVSVTANERIKFIAPEQANLTKAGALARP